MRHVFYRIGIIFALLITMGATSVSASNAHHCLIGEPITTWKTTDNWSKNYEEFALTSPANTKWDEFCIYMWVETNQTFAFNNHFFNPGEAKQVGPSSDKATINKDGGTGVGVATDGTYNAWKYTGAAGLVKICAAQSSGGNGQGEWKPYVWVEESKEIEILKGNKIMFYFGMTTSWNENWNVLRTSNTSVKTADQQYHRLPESKCSSWISVAYVSPAQYYVGKTGWAGVQMESTAEAGCLYSVYNDGSDKIYKNMSVGAIPHFATTTVNKTVGAVDSEIAATVTKSIYGNEQVLYYYYTTDGGTTFTKFDPSDISSLAVGVYTVYALGWDGHILVRSDNTVTLNVGVTISLDANGGTDGDVISVFATSGVAASTGNIAVASLPTKTGYTFNGFWTLGGIEVINENGEWKTDVSGYTDNSGNWICSAASTLYAHWTPKPYIVTLEGMEADSDDPILVNVTYDAVLPSLETKHTKAHYDFGGYWTSSDDGSTLTTQLIDDKGAWIADVSGYTGASGDDPTWVHADNITLYAKWTEHEYAITIAVTGSGSTNPASSTTAKYVTASGDISAIPASGYSFRDWDFSKTGEDNDVYSADGYSSVSNPIHILAQHDGTLTANFTANGYTVTLEDLDADEGHKGTSSVSVTYDATTNLTSSITSPQKAHYDFGGYWTSTDEGAHLTTQLIDADGAWIADVSGYTSASKQWIYAGDITLYAKWTETAYTITPSVSPAGAGSVNTVTDAHLITPSSTITATPANAAWTFDYWEYGDHVGYASGSGNAITVTASQNSTITAHFKPRFSLVGSLYEGDEGGMPGWEDYTKTFAVNSTSPMDLSRTCTLQANSTYKVQVHDNATSTNLGRSGCDPVCVLEENASLVMENSNNDVFLYTSGAGEYIFKITAVDGSGHPTLTVLRPYPVNFGQKYQDIDGTLHTGTTGGTAAATAGSALSSGDYVTYNTSVTHTATPAGGYTFAGWWSSDAFEGDRFSNTNPMTYAVTSGDNAYAKFVETSTSVTLANDGHGKVQIGEADATSTTCGVTTTRELTAVPNEGYKFSSWSKSGDDITLSSTSTNPTTLSGNGSGATSGQTVTANFEERYSIKGTMNGENWGTTHTLTNIGTNAGSKDTCYVTMTLPANTTYEFAIYDEQTGGWYKAGTDAVYDMTYTNHTNWEFGDTKTYNCGITTAGKGTYKFIFNITDKTVTVVYPTSYQVNYGASPSVGGNITVVDDDSQAVPNGGYVRSGGSVTYTAAAASGYTFVGWCGSDEYGETFNTELSWTHSSVTATSNSYAKFKSTNFVIYRTGDMSSDPRAAYDDVESYAGGTISETIEFRMRVNRLDYWYTLCLPFEVNAVQVWEDGAYYDIVPYYRTGDKYNIGHYIIRTPLSTTDFAIENFDSRDRWVDPSSADGYRPSANTPYIIQWHDGYFSGKYISFFGDAGQTIPTSMNQGANTSSDETVNIYGNNCMTSGTVRDAYMLDPDYGSGGAWLRAEVGTDRTVLPFECFIRANATTTAKYRVLRRDMADTPTGWDTVSETENKTTKVLIDNNIYIIRGDRMYTIQGTLVKEGK